MRSSRTSIRPAWMFGLLVALLATGRVVLPYVALQVDPVSLFQYIAFPIVLLFFLLVPVNGHRLPRLVLLFGAAFVLAGAASTFTHISARGNTVVVARLKDDTLQSKTSILREQLERSSPSRTPARFQQDPITPKDGRAVRQILETYPALSAVVWGSTRWLQVDFRSEEPILLSSFTERSYGQFLERMYGAPDLMITTGVDRIGLSFEPAADSAQFIAELVAVRNFLKISPERHHDPEQRLRAVGLLKAGWTSNAHRGYARFLLGTLHLIDVLSYEEYSPGELKCAIGALSAGLLQLRPGDNAELKAALLNNLGVAYFVQGISERKSGARKLSRALWQKSKKVRRERNLIGLPLKSPAVSRYNLKLMKTRVHRDDRYKRSQRRNKG